MASWFTKFLHKIVVPIAEEAAKQAVSRELERRLPSEVARAVEDAAGLPPVTATGTVDRTDFRPPPPPR